MAGSLWLIVGSAVFIVGAAYGVPSVFMTSNLDERVGLLAANRRRWQIAQVFYGLGPAVAGIGVGVVGFGIGGGGGAVLGAAGSVMVVGAVCWSYSCWLRGLDPVAFARGQQSGWPFRTYVWLTIAGLALSGIGLLLADTRAWLGWIVLVADLGYLVLFVVTEDIPPFVFYLLLMVVGVFL